MVKAAKIIAIIAACVLVIVVIAIVGTSGESAPAPPPDKTIVIKYSCITTDQIGEWFHADSGYTYLVISLDIRNTGYDSFGTNPFYFSVIVNDVRYDTTWVGLDDELKMVDLLDGGKISGKLAFEVPEEVTSTGYQLEYQAWETCDIEWIKQ